VREDLTFESSGARCAAWLYRPPSTAPAPCVVLGHGFDGVREQRLDAYAERFAAAGLAALAFDYRRFGSSEGEPRQLFDNGDQLDDWRAAIACARDQEGIDPDRIALWGTSTSGGHVVALAAEDPRIAAVVAQVPLTDGLAQLLGTPVRQSARLLWAAVRDRVGAFLGRPPLLIPAAGRPGALAAATSPDALSGLAAITPPESTWRNATVARFALGTAAYRPVRRAGRVRCPMLLCVADGDRLIPHGPALKVARAAARAELRRYPIGHFAVYAGDGFDRVVADQEAFLRRVVANGRPA
jgi:dienelactone hydrolase